ncbi:MAG: UbiA family prenyltransferase [Candidatus Thermoplasmatota archaeon]|jgi:4-hydroxybenzoate polyprenyltransferase|nr:UbiA family prenyltransferase [Candidatus Thermoplasmatota archaeon]MDP7266512.1 UbiA family prenyltransferase [Candidatus Thermoplasmatota archaeon]
MEMIKDFIKMMRLHPPSWWGEYALFSIIVPCALLFHENQMSLDISKLLPLLGILFTGYCSTFVLNHITDVKEDSYKENQPLMTDGKIRRALFLWISLIIAEIAMALIFFNITALVLLGILQLLSILYSWGIRLKESIAGPLVGSTFYWGPIPLVVVVLLGTSGFGIWKCFTTPMMIHILAMFFFGIERELTHNLFDFDIDRKAGITTFGQIVGVKRTKIIIRVMKGFFLISMLALGWAISLSFSVLVLLFALLGVAGFIPSFYFFSLLAVGLLLSGRTGVAEILLLFCMIPAISMYVTKLVEKTRAGIHQGTAAARRILNDIHAQHRKLIFTIFERIK